MSDRKFGFVFAVALATLAGVLWLLFGTVFRGLLVAAAVCAVTALVAPGLLLPINRMWMLLARRLGWFNNHVILGIIFLLVITPAGMFMRLFGRDPMTRKREPEAESYLVPVARQTDPETMQDIF